MPVRAPLYFLFHVIHPVAVVGTVTMAPAVKQRNDGTGCQTKKSGSLIARRIGEKVQNHKDRRNHEEGYGKMGSQNVPVNPIDRQWPRSPILSLGMVPCRNSLLISYLIT
jgi:hypothetical protein